MKLDRKDFLKLLISSILSLVPGKIMAASSKRGSLGVIRPPAVLPESEFVDRCVRCGNCMKVCPTNVLQPAMLESGAEGIWTPRLNMGIGYCEYSCNLCGKVCPTGAINSITVETKMKTKMGRSVVDRNECIAWAKAEDCIVCEEQCPVSDKAVKFEIHQIKGRLVKVPVVDISLCVGCGACEYNCPARPQRAITVIPLT